jgi:muconolactone delta-isomerase
MLFFIRLDGRQPDGMPLSEFRKAWHRGALTTRESRDSGIIQSFKVVGRRTIFAIAEAPDNEALDKALAGLPIVEDLGSAVEIEVIPMVSYEDFAAVPERAAEQRGESLDQEADVHGQPGLPDAP